jgi:hypothetical protein
MDVYGSQRLARIEHEQMVRSLPTVPEYGSPLAECQREKKRRVLWLHMIFTALLYLLLK